MSHKIEYNTKQRDLILSCLDENRHHHMTAEEMHTYINEHLGQVGQATVYRHLSNLVKAGRVIKVASAQGMPASFQIASQPETCRNFFHMICTQCDSINHLDCDEAERLARHIKKEHGFVVDKFKTIMYGICDKCIKKL